MTIAPELEQYAQILRDIAMRDDTDTNTRVKAIEVLVQIRNHQAIATTKSSTQAWEWRDGHRIDG